MMIANALAIRVVVENGRKYRVRGDRKLAVYIEPSEKTCGMTGRHLFVSGYWKSVKLVSILDWSKSS